MPALPLKHAKASRQRLPTFGVITPWQSGSFTPNIPAMSTNTSPQNQQQGNTGSCYKSTHDEVARAAFLLYEKYGSENGQDMRNWLDAEAHVKSKRVSALHGHQAAERPVGQSAH